MQLTDENEYETIFIEINVIGKIIVILKVIKIFSLKY